MKKYQRGFAPVILLVLILVAVVGFVYIRQSQPPISETSQEDKMGEEVMMENGGMTLSDVIVLPLNVPTNWDLHVRDNNGRVILYYTGFDSVYLEDFQSDELPEIGVEIALDNRNSYERWSKADGSKSLGEEVVGEVTYQKYFVLHFNHAMVYLYDYGGDDVLKISLWPYVEGSTSLEALNQFTDFLKSLKFVR